MTKVKKAQCPVNHTNVWF